MHIFFLGYPGNMGGANTECWHTAKLWRGAGIDVTFVPTWGRDPQWESRLADIGCTTVHAGSADDLASVPGFAGSIVVGMCNSNVLKAWPVLKRLQCRIVWVNCMTFLFPEERAAYAQHGPADAYVFQSRFQQEELEPKLLPLGYMHHMGHLIHGAFDLDAFPFTPQPHKRGEPFCVGKLARPDLDKWSSNHWRILERVPYASRRALAMGWNAGLDHKCGPRPSWAECHAPQAFTAQEFLARCHALLGLNGGARENWPRVGLEAMACGVPLVCQNLWGWREMIINGVTGFLTDSDDEMAYRLAQLAYDEHLRLLLTANARDHLERLTDPHDLTEKWTRLFHTLAA